MGFEVLETESFSRQFESLEEEEKAWIRKMIAQLEANSEVGKPLGFKWFREKKYEGKRLYYLVYRNAGKVLLVAFGDKKEQREIIRHVLANRERYAKIVGVQP